MDAAYALGATPSAGQCIVAQSSPISLLQPICSTHRPVNRAVHTRGVGPSCLMVDAEAMTSGILAPLASICSLLSGAGQSAWPCCGRVGASAEASAAQILEQLLQASGWL
ncbi:unnamed protein product [Symbiodinium natans]|uniref:Uncharacterized protein n=1 Tax=Symbiodinium natans TaxID=878477 RepID=A0A812RC62_9DINO|nr:unnamed protein product [Symbiodinium natans]